MRNFKKFIFVLEHEDAEMGYSEDQADHVGSLAVIDPLTTFNKKCRNSIIETNDLPKPEVRVSDFKTKSELISSNRFLITGELDSA